QKTISDVTKIQNWYYTETSPSCIVLFNAIDETVAHPQNINLYPNPTTNLLTLNFNASNQGAQFRIYDTRGVLIQNVAVSNSGTTTIQTENWASGIYFVEIIDNGKIYFGKFIRQ
ncbi:MAG: T9SS type A sorting domain-containing protein, partial [Bacteroidia bacterium]